jgi:hypothetical protein
MYHSIKYFITGYENIHMYDILIYIIILHYMYTVDCGTYPLVETRRQIRR